MSMIGHELFRAHDEFGPIQVFENGSQRYLCFGTPVQQSAVDMLVPSRLCFEYTQAMALGLLFTPQQPDVLLLGLGGGSLAHAVLAHAAPHQLVAIERRQAVAEIARDWFALPDDPRLTIEIADGGEYISRRPGPFDLIFADLYHADGMDDQQAELRFLEQAREALKPGGCLVLNLWTTDGTAFSELRRNLMLSFGDLVLSTSVKGGNHLALCFNEDMPRHRRKPFFEKAGKLGMRMQIPLAPMARALWNQNYQRMS